MNYKIKSTLYFATLVLAIASYYLTDVKSQPAQNEIAAANIEQVISK